MSQVLNGQTINGCSDVAKIHYTTYGVLCALTLPFILWGALKHVKMYHRTPEQPNKLLYRLSIALYLCTISSSIFTMSTSFGACIIWAELWIKLWTIQSYCWLLQWVFFILLLFSRYIYTIYKQIYTYFSCMRIFIKTE